MLKDQIEMMDSKQSTESRSVVSLVLAVTLVLLLLLLLKCQRPFFKRKASTRLQQRPVRNPGSAGTGSRNLQASNV